MLLCIMRHGEAVAGYPDAKRPLSERGLQQCGIAGKQLVTWLTAHPQCVVSPHIEIVASPYVRARQSAHAMSAVLEERGWVMDYQLSDAYVPDASPQKVVEQWCGEEWQGLRVLVSHMPLVSYLAALWLEGNTVSAVPMQTSEWLLLEADIWASGCATLLHHFTGSLLE